ncbi:MAG: 50S ribosomal protein L37ae [Candidatus Bathyarchaeota archaeon]|nr:50S ribosomal protein L37ae [Candidatus Bathyarchaeota archaeon]MDW8040767.1 50S ribosomal protein L37ae [Nitrososphaerota archaeon]
MGKRTKKVGPTRGLGARYGATVRKRYVKIVTEMKKKHKCPRCGLSRVKRVSVGVWKCRKCGYTFAGGAYTPTTKLGVVAKRVAKGAPVAEAEVSTTLEAEEE